MKKKISEQQRKQVIELLKAGKTIPEIIRITGISYPSVSRIRTKYRETIDPTQPIVDTNAKTVESPKEINSSDLIQLEDLIQKTPEQKATEVKITQPTELIRPVSDSSKSMSMDQIVGSSVSNSPQTPDADKLKAAQTHAALIATTITQAAFKVGLEKEMPKEQVELIKTSWDQLAPFLITTAASDKNAAIAGVVIAYATVVALNFNDIKAVYERAKQKKAAAQQPIQKVQNQEQPTMKETPVIDPTSVDFPLPK